MREWLWPACIFSHATRHLSAVVSAYTPASGGLPMATNESAEAGTTSGLEGSSWIVRMAAVPKTWWKSRLRSTVIDGLSFCLVHSSEPPAWCA